MSTENDYSNLSEKEILIETLKQNQKQSKLMVEQNNLLRGIKQNTSFYTWMIIISLILGVIGGFALPILTR